MRKNEKGYAVVISQDSNFYIDGVSHIERDDSCNPPLFMSDEEAAAAAEKDGIKLIRDMALIEPGVYLDTPENRAALEQVLRENNCPYNGRLENGDREFTVSFAVNGRCRIGVFIPPDMSDEDAVSYALKKANEIVTETDFGELEDIDWEAHHVEDENGNYIYPDE